MCIHPGCKTRPAFNNKDEYPIYCASHKKEGMIDVISKRCIHEECIKRPSFNKEGYTPLYCSTHKKEGMVDVISKRCIHEGCKISPSFNKEGYTPLYCATHKLEGMVDVKSKRCIHERCNTRPVFNHQGAPPLYCSTHKKEGMVDVKNTRCIHEGCKIRPHYNIEGNPPIYCASHKKERMINVINTQCIHEGCKIRPHYNIEGKPPIYCASHKKEGMINVINKHCKTPLCLTLIQEKYDGYCLFCYINTFPDKLGCRNYKTKEYAVVEYVNTNYPLPWITDKRIDGGCSRRRPDLLLDLGDQVIIVEVDENQHIDYDCSCENKRIMELSRDLAHRPIVLIRFNPDDYKKDGIKIKSCWGTDQKGICVLKKTKKEEWNQRLHTLGETIEYWLNHRTDKMIEIIPLFYLN